MYAALVCPLILTSHSSLANGQNKARRPPQHRKSEPSSGSSKIRPKENLISLRPVDGKIYTMEMKGGSISCVEWAHELVDHSEGWERTWHRSVVGKKEVVKVAGNFFEVMMHGPGKPNGVSRAFRHPNFTPEDREIRLHPTGLTIF